MSNSTTLVLSGSEKSVDLTYDGKSRRISKTVSNWVSGAWQLESTNRFLYDGWNLIAVLTSSSALQSAYVWGLDLSGTMQGAGGVGGLLVVTNSGNGAHFCAYDGNGNVAALVKASDGTVSANYEYGPFGEALRVTGTMAKANPMRFSSKYQDEESDFLYYGYRSYNPSVGRWLSRDPVGERAGPDRYAFGWNDAINQKDLLGLLVEMPPTSPGPPPTIPPETFPIPIVRPPVFPRIGPPQVAACIVAAKVGWEIGKAIDAAQDHLVSDYWGEQLGDCIEKCRRARCSYRHPTWMKCRKDATSSPSAAVERDAPTVQGWSGPYVTSVYSAGDAKKMSGRSTGEQILRSDQLCSP